MNKRVTSLRQPKQQEQIIFGGGGIMSFRTVPRDNFNWFLTNIVLNCFEYGFGLFAL